MNIRSFPRPLSHPEVEFPEGPFQRLFLPPLLPGCSFGRKLLQILAH